MFKNIFNPPDSLRNALMGQDELRAKSQQGLQAVRSGVESLRTVLANHPVEPSKSNIGRRGQDGPNSSSASTASRRGTVPGIETRAESEAESWAGSESGTGTGTGTGSGSRAGSRSGSERSSKTRDRSGSWSSFLPPSMLSGRHVQAHNNDSSSSSSSISNDTGSTFSTTTTPGHQRPGSFKDMAGSITDSVAVSIKNLGTGLKLGHLAEGLGLNGSDSGSISTSVFGLGSSTQIRRGTGDSQLQQQQQQQQNQEQGPYMNALGGQTNKSHIWVRNRQDSHEDRSEITGDTDSIKRRKEMLHTGVKPEEAAKEIAALLARQRKQHDLAMERAKRMPEVEKMAQRYQDTWIEIHNHTARNSERADAAEEILTRVIELCTRHAKAATLLKEESKDLKDLDKSLDEMVSMAESIQKKLVGLESVIERLEERTDAMSLEDWKRAQTAELDKYMEMKRNKLWDKAELLSTRSKQFQKEEAARKLLLYQNQFETDMAQYWRTQEEKKQELWKIAESEADTLVLHGELGNRTGSGRYGMSKSTIGTSVIPSSPSSSSLIQDGPRIHSDTDPLAVPVATLMAQKEEERKEQEDLDRFLGPGSESDSKEDTEEDNKDDEEEEEEEAKGDDDDYDEDEDEDEEDEESSEDELDPIAMARKVQAAAAIATAKRSYTGATISAFSSLASHSSTTSLSKH